MRLIQLARDLMLPVKNKGSAYSLKVIQDDYMKEICSPGSYGPNPTRMQLDKSKLFVSWFVSK